MDYPHFKLHLTNSELVEHFSLASDERYLLSQWRKNPNCIGFAILLKSFQFLGYPPREKQDIPDVIVNYICCQLNLDPKQFSEYRWKDSVWKSHLSTIREFTGFRHNYGEDFQELIQWLVGEAKNHPTRTKMFSAAIQRCRALRLELPVENELRKFVNSAWQQYLDRTCQKISQRLSPEIRSKMDKCLDYDPKDKERYEWIKANPRKFGMKTLLCEIRRLQFINEIGIEADIHLNDVPEEVLRLLHERAAPEGSYQMKRHPPDYKYALLAALLYFRSMELIDNIIDIFLQLIRRIEKKADKKLERDIISSIKAVYKKKEFLYKMAKAVTENPHGTVENVVFPVVGKEILNQIIAEYEGRELNYENTQIVEKKKRYTGSYRRMMKPVLDILIFKTSNPTRQPLLDGIAMVHKYLIKKQVCYPETEIIPEGLKLTGPWKEMVIEDEFGNPLIIKHYFELFVLQKLEKALRNKEIWVEGSYRHRNPDKDLPQDLTEKLGHYCKKHKIPERSEDFIDPIREELTQSLVKANKFFGEKRDVYIYYPGNGEKGVFRIPKIVKGPDHPILTEIKQKTMDRWGILDLSDILIEADRQVNFTRFFYSTAQRQVLSHNEIRERLLLSLLGHGTGLGLKRIHTAAKPSFSYEDLVYFNKRYVHIDSLQEAIAALVNRILEVRSPELWGNTTACTSDGKYLGSWEQNLAAQWNPHYQECGIMMYSMVDKNSAGIHAQVRRGTEISAMISALICHDTNMAVGSNTVDSHGQSELGFSFSRFLSVELHPWLKRMKYEKLYLPDLDTKKILPNFSGVLARDIRWDLAHEHYKDMARHVIAAKERTAPVDALLRRFNRNNPANQTYKGFLEIGKALKTIHNCRFLTDPSYRQKIHSERNVAENWNSAIDFICYGGKAEIQTNDPVSQELTVLSLHLLQDSLAFVNTVLLEHVYYKDGFIHKMKASDKNAMTPLFTSNVNPYGEIHLDINKPSFMEGH